MAGTEQEDERAQSRSPRQSRAQRPNLAGLDLDPEADDEEYKEQDESAVKEDADGDAEVDGEGEEEDEEEEDLEDGEDDDDLVKSGRRRGGRKRKAASEEAEDGENDDEENGSHKKAKIKAEDEEENGEGGEGGDDKEESVVSDSEGKPKKKGRKRGRKPKVPRPEDVVYDDKGNEITVENDEIVLKDEDPKGKEKVDEYGRLQGDRKYRVKTFTLLGKGDRLYMVSTEPARLVGFRDSYLLFKTHLSLFKKVCTNEEKMDLINRHLIPTSYKGRSVNLVTARSIFREFGARMIVEGKKVTDDFWEQRARDRGDVEGEYADPEEMIGSNKMPNFAAGENPYQAQMTGAALINYQADPTWLYQVCKQTSEYNASLAEARNQVWLRGIKDPYSGFNFYPTGSQPTRASVAQIQHDDDESGKDESGKDESSVQCSIRFYNPDIRRKMTGLATIPKEVLDEVDDDDIKKAILEQQDYERKFATF